VVYSPSDPSPNYTADFQSELAARRFFRAAHIAEVTGGIDEALQGYNSILAAYPASSIAPSALRSYYDLSLKAGNNRLSEYLASLIENHSASPLGRYAFRLMNLLNPILFIPCLVWNFYLLNAYEDIKPLTHLKEIPNG